MKLAIIKRLPSLVIVIVLAILAGCNGKANDSGGGGSKVSILISGRVQYEDREYVSSTSNTGYFTNTTKFKALRHAVVEVVDSANSVVIGTAMTDADGNYSVTVQTYERTLYARVHSSAELSSNAIIQVAFISNGALYAVPSASFLPNGDVIADISIPVSNAACGAFNILDVMVSGYEFVYSLAGIYPPELSVFWQPQTALGTFYCSMADGYDCPQGHGIYVTNEPYGDTDEFDDDVLWHEFGHFASDAFSIDQSPGGLHSLVENDLDLRLAWSEGWGNFFQAALKNWISVTHPLLLSSQSGTSLYVDTNAGSGYSFDFGNPPVYSYIYSSNEVAVAKVLWDIMSDSSLGMQAVWDVVSSFKSEPPATLINLETFWDRWLSQRDPEEPEITKLNTYLSGRKIYYHEDEDEENDSTLTAHAIPSSARTLYKRSGIDKDYYFFNAVQGTDYAISTTSLSNGADTYISVYDSAGLPVSGTQNDNINPDKIYVSGINYDYYNYLGDYVYPRNNTVNLSSSIPSFSPPVTGTYYVEVKTSPDIPFSAGRYGTYMLTISPPPL